MMILMDVILICFFGYKLSNIFLPKVEKLEQIFLGFVLGIGIFTFIWFLLNWVGVPYSMLSGLILILVLNVLVFFVPVKSKFSTGYFSNLTLIEKFGIGFLIFICFSALIQSLYWPVHGFDSMVLYDFRAKVFALTGSMQPAIAKGYFFSYPLLTSLAHAWVYVLGGINPSFLHALWYISFLVIFLFNLRKLKIERTLAIFLTVAVSFSPRLFDHTQWAYTNLPYTVYIVLGYIYLYFGLKNKDIGSYIVSALLVALSTWTRAMDPFWLPPILIAIGIPILRKKWKWSFIYVLIFLSTVLPWRIFQKIYNISVTNAPKEFAPESLNALPKIDIFSIKPAFDFIIANVVNPYLVYFILLGIVIVIKLFIKSKQWLFMTLVMLDLLLFFAGTVILASNTTYWQDIPDSLARMFMFVPALIIFLLAELSSEMKKG